MSPEDPIEQRPEDRIGNVIRLAGRRPAVPPERNARARAAVLADWRHAVEQRSRVRRTWFRVAAAAAAVILVAVAVNLRPSRTAAPVTAADVARVELVAGTVWHRPDSAATASAPAALRAGDPVAVGAELSSEAHARVALTLASGPAVRFDAGTRVRVLSARALELVQGAVYVDSGATSADGTAVSIRTAFGVVTEIGTQFEVRLEREALRICVREGAVRLDGDGMELTVERGYAIDVDREGTVRQHLLAPSGDAWAWTGEIAPRMQIEGRRLREFLDWVARERGLALEFSSPALAESANTIVLDGSIDGLTLEQALEAVLPTCRMTHRVEGEHLVVFSLP